MRLIVLVSFVALAFSSSALGQSDLEKGFGGALRGCEEWVLNPKSWSNGFAPFVSTVGLGDKMASVDHVDEAALPPLLLRAGNHFWRINSTTGAGFILVVSDQLPICHITGGGNVDLQPVISSVLASSEFARRWKLVKESPHGDMVNSEFESIEKPRFSLAVSRAGKPGGRLDRVQILATAVVEVSPDAPDG